MGVGHVDDAGVIFYFRDEGAGMKIFGDRHADAQDEDPR